MPWACQIWSYKQKTRGMAVNTSISCSSSRHNTHHPEDGMKLLQELSNMVPQLGCYMAWMNNIPVYWLRPMLGWPYTCIHKSCGMDGTISMTCGYLHHNTRNPADVMVVLQVLVNLVQQIVCYWVLINVIPVNWLCPRLYRHCTSICKMYELGYITLMVCGSLYHRTYHHADGTVIL